MRKLKGSDKEKHRYLEVRKTHPDAHGLTLTLTLTLTLALTRSARRTLMHTASTSAPSSSSPCSACRAVCHTGLEPRTNLPRVPD